MKNWFSIAVMSLSLCAAGCGRDNDTPRASTDTGPTRPVILTDAYPTLFLVERIGADRVHAVLPLPEGADPIFWMPDDAAIRMYQDADLIVLNGAGFAKWVDKVSLPEARVVKAADALPDPLIRYEHAVEHSHGPSGDHAHEGIDGHTWLDPVNAAAQADRIRAGMVEAFPAHRMRFEKAHAALASDLQALNRELHRVSTRLGNTPLLASHPAYNYVARRYGWNLRNLDLDPEAVPDANTLATVEQAAREHGAHILLWESAPSAGALEAWQAALDLKHVVFSPAEMPPATGDYLTVMAGNIARLTAALPTP